MAHPKANKIEDYDPRIHDKLLDSGRMPSAWKLPNTGDPIVPGRMHFMGGTIQRRTWHKKVAE